MSVLEVRHRTEYHYRKPVRASYGQLHLLPRDGVDGQRCRSSEITITPTPEVYRERVDFFANRVSSFVLGDPHRTLSVQAVSVVEVDDPASGFSGLDALGWEQVRDAVAAGDHGDPEISQYLLDSPLVGVAEDYRAYASESFRAGAGVLEAVGALTRRIHGDFAYRPGSTTVSTPLHEVFARRRGVCQDFAHVEIACLRAIGLPARYVSGYLETDPPPGQPKLTGVDGSHAWLAVHLGEPGWLAVDPTNDQFVNGRYVTLAVGRDYSDVPPMQGVIYTDGPTESLTVTVDVSALV